VSLFATSNELPEGKEFEALFDRFLLRFDVGYLLVAANLRCVLVGPSRRSPVHPRRPPTSIREGRPAGRHRRNLVATSWRSRTSVDLTRARMLTHGTR